MLSYLANPARFMGFSAWAAPLFLGLAIALFAVGVPWGLFASPADYQQGETVRIVTDFSHPFLGDQVYMVHCHNLEHEDGGMMVNLKVTA